MVHLHFSTLRFVIRKCHGYGSKLWEFWVVSMALLGAKPHGFGWEMRAEGWMISPSRLRHFPDSTPALPRVDSAASRSRLLYPQPVDSATHLTRLGGAFESTPIPTPSRGGDAFESTRNCKDCKPWEIKKGADSSESTPEQP